MLKSISSMFGSSAPKNSPVIPQPQGERGPEYAATFRIMELVKPYYLTKYEKGVSVQGFNVPSFGAHTVKRTINGVAYKVERYNHALAHGLRQGALAKDLFDYLATLPKDESTKAIHGLLDWVEEKKALGSLFLQKLEMTSAFQRTGRQSEASGTANPELYKVYEDRSIRFFQKAAVESVDFGFTTEEIRSLTKGIKWVNYPSPEPDYESREKLPNDERYFKAILHAAHILDLRRIPQFNGEQVKHEFILELLGMQALSLPKALTDEMVEILWDRSRQYLEATGDRDLVLKRKSVQDHFFIQTAHPELMVHAVDQVRQRVLGQ